VNIEELRNEIKLEAAESASFQVEAFARVFARHLEDSERLFDSNIEVLSCRGPRGRRLELTGYSEDSTDETLTLIIGRYFGADETLTLSEAKDVSKRAMGFLEHSLDGWLAENLEASSREVEYADYFASRVRKSQISRVKIIVLTDGLMSDRIREIDSENLDGLRVSYEIWDQRRVLDAVLPELGSEDIVVDFTKWMPNGLPCLVADSNEHGTQTILAVLPAQILASIFDEYGSLLLESNVRTFLSARGKVNSGIQGTLAYDPAKFLAYNNGLTTTAKDVHLFRTGEGTFIKTIERWQIVNGGQTTASISHYLRGDKNRTVEGVYVQMKLVKVDPTNSSDIVQSVAKYANSQNLVSTADLFSTHEFHVRMEVISRRLRAPSKEGQQYQTGWYYERARGQWENDRTNSGRTAAQKNFELEYPRNQRVTKTDWAKYHYSWGGKPNLVSKGAQSVFAEFAVSVDKAWDADEAQFAENYFQEGVALAIIYEELRSNVIQAEWYRSAPGYLANIVTYAIARFSKYVRDTYPGQQVNLAQIWKSQRISDHLKSALMQVAKLAQTHLTDPGRPQANVTQWAKQQACWDSFSKASFQLAVDLTSDLIGNSEALEIKSEDRKIRQIDSSLEAMATIIEIEADTWDLIIAKLNEANPSPKERDLVKLFSYKKAVPSELQAKVLLRLIQRMQSVGLIPL
jgi:hypothetical protein